MKSIRTQGADRSETMENVPFMMPSEKNSNAEYERYCTQVQPADALQSNSWVESAGVGSQRTPIGEIVNQSYASPYPACVMLNVVRTRGGSTLKTSLAVTST